MKELDYLKDMLCTEVKKITQQNDFTTSTLETAYKIVDMLKDIEEIQEKEGHQYEKDGSYGYWGVGYGGRMPYNDRYSYGNNNMNMGGRGNYAYDDGYRTGKVCFIVCVTIHVSRSDPYALFLKFLYRAGEVSHLRHRHVLDRSRCRERDGLRQ